MRVLVVGSGAREHALCWRLREDGATVLAAPGSDAIGRIAERIPLADPKDIASWADQGRVDLVVIGPEAPLAAGLADRLRQRRIPVVGPNQAAARIESSKTWARAFCRHHGIPGPRFATAMELPRDLPVPCVVKTDGLAAGKGVVVVREEADERRARALPGPYIIEELLEGKELSVFALCDGRSFAIIGDARDYKRLLAGDDGPNTGGMGAFSPVGEADLQQIADTVIAPAVDGMAAEGCPFAGFLYAGLMLTAAGPKVLEFNARLGDPEAQVVLPRWRKPFTELLQAAAHGALAGARVALAPDHAVGVVLASPGYPDNPQPGQRMPDLPDDGLIFHAATVRKPDGWYTAGGRVLTAVALGADRAEARARASALADRLMFAGAQRREDVGR
jgi:phosphoribosylamine--glycine ligase